MHKIVDVLLHTTDRAVSRTGHLNRLVELVVNRIAPQTEAAAGCTGASCGYYCGSDCRWHYQYKVGTGCLCEVTGLSCSPC